LASFTSAGSEWRAARYGVPAGRSVVAADLASVKAELQSALRSALTLVIPMALALTALGAWVLANLSLRPVNRLRMAMKDMTPKALDRRLPSGGEDREFKALIAEYNIMLARLEASFHQASRFSADAAHELKTPLTILQGRLERAVSRSDKRAVQVDLTEMLDEVGLLAAITRKLLLLSQADAGRLALSLAPVDLTELLGELVVDAQMLVTDQVLSSAIEPGLVTQGDALLLRQLFNNLVNNAVRYCRPGGAIEVRSRKLPGGVETSFTNETRFVAADERARFFERFFRGDPAHGRSVEGSGLGLSLAREIARAHGGELTLEPGALDVVRLRLWLPQA
jgi:two-component system, OmpR family, heavy metal sensor histidine kinase CusS